MPHVLIPDSVHQRAIDIVTNAAGLTVSAPGKLSQDELVAQVGTAHALIIRSGVKITPDVFAAAPNLKIVARAGVGVDNVDLEAATRHGVVVVNTPGGNTISTAEHTFGLMLALARHIPQGHATLKAGRWDRKLFEGVELREKTLGLVGFGRIGQAMALRAKAFEMSVIAYDPYLNDVIFNDMGVQRVDLDTLYAQSDFISLHAPKLPDTQVLDADAIAKMKNGVRIINAARGALIVDADLAAAIQSGKVAGAALDVFEPEPPAADNPLIGLDGVIHTPHLAASTSDAQVTVAIEAAQLVVDALLNGTYINVVNPAVLETIG
jgi:D-3-phosphoglycerate dehydrogenase / 2-oxoglutarate reductase